MKKVYYLQCGNLTDLVVCLNKQALAADPELFRKHPVQSITLYSGLPHNDYGQTVTVDYDTSRIEENSSDSLNISW